MCRLGRVEVSAEVAGVGAEARRKAARRHEAVVHGPDLAVAPAFVGGVDSLDI